MFRRESFGSYLRSVGSNTYKELFNELQSETMKKNQWSRDLKDIKT